MTRACADWLQSYIEYAKYTETPIHMHFWSGVSAIAGALRRKVWIDQVYFKWFPNFYICLVAPPAIVSKSTTTGIATNLLRQVPDISFGPDITTMPALMQAFSESACSFTYGGLEYMMSPLMLDSSEFGNLLNTSDREMVDLLVALYDSKPGAFTKRTRHFGSDFIENPLLNILACTTPSWISKSFSEYMIGGGLVSRTLFVYADTKRKFVAYPGLHVPPDQDRKAAELVADLTHISKNLAGPVTLSPDAVEWGETWYKQHYTTRSLSFDADRFSGYLSRKQAHIHKLAMVLSVSAGDSLVITAENLIVAAQMVSDLEPDMRFVFNRVGRNQITEHVQRLVEFVHKAQEVPFTDAYRYVHSLFPSLRNFEDLLAGCVRAGYIKIIKPNGVPTLQAGTPLPTATNHTQD